MPVNITIRNVPDAVHEKLVARAAASGRSMQEFLLRELTVLTTRLPADEAIRRARAHAKSLPPITIEEILEALDADRR